MMRNQDPNYRVLYANCPHNWLNFDVHTPMVIDTRDFAWPVDRPIKTAYANTHNLAGTRYRDVKIRKKPSYQAIMDEIKGSPFFSSDGNVQHEGLLQVLNELYPDASPFES